jgi:hypothetical protein
VVVSRLTAGLVLALVAGTAAAAPRAKAKAKPKPPPGLTPEQEAEVKQHVAAATEAHAAGKLDVALSELRAAYAIDPRPDFVFAIGQVQAGQGDCAGARESYEQYRAALKNEAGIGAAVDAAIAACGAAPEPATEPAPAPAPPSAAVVTARPWYADVVGDALVGGGAVALVASALEYRAARSALDDAEHAPTLADYESRVDSAHGDRTVSLVLGVAGVALVAGGVYHFMRHGASDETSNVAIVPTGGGGMLVLSGEL